MDDEEKKHLERLLKLLKGDWSKGTVKNGAQATFAELYKRDSGQAGRLMTKLLNHENAELRGKGCVLVKLLNRREFADVLAERLSDSESGVVRRAASALGEVGGPEHVSNLVDVLKAFAGKPDVRVAAIEAIGKIGLPANSGLLTIHLQTGNRKTRNAAKDALESISRRAAERR